MGGIIDKIHEQTDTHLLMKGQLAGALPKKHQKHLATIQGVKYQKLFSKVILMMAF